MASSTYKEAVSAYMCAVVDLAVAALALETQRLDDQTETIKSATRMLRGLVESS